MSDRWAQPTPLDAVQLAFPADALEYMPSMSEIPSEFKDSHNDWCVFVTRWFGFGLSPETDFMPRQGVDAETAFKHVAAVLRSFAPKHEHKEAAAAYLLSRWFEGVRYAYVTRQQVEDEPAEMSEMFVVGNFPEIAQKEKA